MTKQSPKITTLTPTVFTDNRRVTLDITVDNLPTTFANVALVMPDLATATSTPPPKPDPDAPSPYPNVELSILNSQRQQVAALFIVEHKEPQTSLTLHLRSAPNVNEKYTARAEMTYQDEILDVVEAPFTLHQLEP